MSKVMLVIFLMIFFGPRLATDAFCLYEYWKRK